jgi:hypothetical protein
MLTTTAFFQYAQWMALAGVGFIILTLLSFILKWGFRFRLVGVTSFTFVLAGGLFALSLGLFTHTTIPGAVRYTTTYDNGGDRVTIAVKNPISKEEVDATLQQAANDLFSYGRRGQTDRTLEIRLRTVSHPAEGTSEPVYLGIAKRDLTTRDNPKIEIINLWRQVS